MTLKRLVKHMTHFWHIIHIATVIGGSMQIMKKEKATKRSVKR